jgi:hypothetical protein
MTKLKRTFNNMTTTCYTEDELECNFNNNDDDLQHEDTRPARKHSTRVGVKASKSIAGNTQITKLGPEPIGNFEL